MKTLLRLCLICLLLAPAASARAEHAAQDNNLLQNPGFEGNYVQQCCHTEQGYAPGTPYSEIQVAPGWSAWWVEPDSSPSFPSYCDYNIAPPSCQPYHQPEYSALFVDPSRVHSGSNAQKYFTFYSTHLAGLYQQVTGAIPGQTYRFTVFMQTWSTDSSVPGAPSSVQTSMGLQVGIDPNGGTDPFSVNIVWGQTQSAFDTWGQFGVDAIAQSSTITVFTRSWPALALRHNDVYVDDASLTAIGSGSDLLPTSPPLSTAPASTSPEITFVPPTPQFITSTPLPSGEIWYTVQPGDTLGRIAYHHETTVDEIKRLNSLTSNLIFANQKLLIKIVTPQPTPTDTPGPTFRPSLTPELVQLPTHTSAPFALSPDYGQLCVVAYNDANRNATNDNEPSLAEVRVILSVGNTPLDGYMTTGDETTHCFPQMPPGSYTVSVTGPASYTATTASEATVQLQPGNRVTLAFGFTAVTESTPASPTAASGATVLLLVIGAAIAFMLMMGMAVFLLAKKK
ncbi:MAG TPA: LysM peptidoglycan-binding domain-containing protein [Anaerolineales bacterium]|nr:LysM peptidoglycan-binding domain-containing protein [Anaerolineales bacterium]